MRMRMRILYANANVNANSIENANVNANSIELTKGFDVLYQIGRKQTSPIRIRTRIRIRIRMPHLHAAFACHICMPHLHATFACLSFTWKSIKFHLFFILVLLPECWDLHVHPALLSPSH